PLQADLPTLFETPGFFGEFYQPLNEGLKRMAFELSGAMTTADHEGIIKELKEDYASGKTVEAYEELKKPHALRPESQRKARLESLGENVPAEAVTLFLALSDSPEVARLRKGLGFAVDFAQEVDTGAANLRIMPAIFDESFGVVEARRIGLNRILKVPETPQEIADLHSKNGIHRKFAEALAGTVNSL
ncbi:MAG TPA: hypothetical protein VLF68_02315, partial [Candidatus Saccharimonadales bacterium]|nr:hypothetical protein [Candidatus Saccharimonadales bacterium]